MRLILLKSLFLCWLSLTLVGCETLKDFSFSQDSDKEDEYKGWDVEQFRKEAQTAVDAGNYEKAVKIYEALEARYPFGETSEQTQLDIAYAYYKSGDADAAMKALKRSGIALSGSAVGGVLCDEEDQMLGVRHFIDRGHGDGVTAAVICEPQDGLICISQKGAIRARYRIVGRMSHGAMPLSGLNTAIAVARLIDGLHRIECGAVTALGDNPLLGWPSFTHTVLRAPASGAPQLNVMPGKAEILVDVRTVTGQNHDEVRKEMTGARASGGKRGFLPLRQAVVFYGAQLVRAQPALKPAIELACRALPCRHRLVIDMHRLDLVESAVTPHPRYDRALRVRATLVNRAEYVQPYPLLEVTLLNSQGQVVARRAYKPGEYLPKSQHRDTGLLPQVAVTVKLDITGPGTEASGYEILLLPPSD